MSQRLLPSARRSHVTQKVKITGLRTLYFSVHDDERPGRPLNPTTPINRPLSSILSRRLPVTQVGQGYGKG
jgi:hypothetical protein